ncbi:MAG: amidohydrolase family protein [Phycisphaerales bacterium]|nr:amidohydrolase family protein [Phycisphaerales bacterium]
MPRVQALRPRARHYRKPREAPITLTPERFHPVPTRTLRLSVRAAAGDAHVWRTDRSAPGVAILLAIDNSSTEHPHVPPDAPPILRVLAIGPAGDVDRHPAAAHALRVDAPDCVAIPALANAHAHLDLTHVGPQPHDPGEGFVVWVDRIRTARHTEDADIAASVRTGAELLLRGGTLAVGDIAGAPNGRPSLSPWRTLRGTPLRGVSYLEFFAIGTREDAALARVEAALEEASSERADERQDQAHQEFACVRLGLQPHATNTVSPRAYRWARDRARRLALPLATHLAETPEEQAFISRATGPQRDMLERFGLWSDQLLADFGLGRHPVDHLLDALQDSEQQEFTSQDTPFLVAHVNDVGAGQEAERRIERLARAGVSVAYCPRASTYFAAPQHFGPHHWRDMLAAGVNVCLGTDSIVNLPAGTGTAPAPIGERGICVLDEMRLLLERDAADPRTLLAMGTTHAARALGLSEAGFRLGIGSTPMGVVLVGPGAGGGEPPGGGRSDEDLRWAFGAERSISLLRAENRSGFAGMIVRGSAFMRPGG